MRVMVCKHCGSQEVRRDAWAAWNPEKEEWELYNYFDAAFCEDCDTETTIEEKEV